MEPRATRSSGSRIPVGVKSGGERRRQELKHSLEGTNKENFEAKKEDKISSGNVGKVHYTSAGFDKLGG